MGHNRATYTLYRYGEYVGEGTAVELSNLAGIAPQTIQCAAAPSYQKVSNKWTVDRVEEHVSKEKVKYEVIRELMAENNYTFRELAKTIGLSGTGLSNKLNRTYRFKKAELEEIEDLFFLEEGELTNDQ